MSDIKHNIRKLEFPYWAREALIRIEQMITGRNIPSPKQLDLVNDLIKEFIFCERDRRGSRRINGLNSLQELHLLDVLCEYFSGSLNDMARNSIFLSLFGGNEASRRLKVLCKLASMAISGSIAPVLLSIAMWMQHSESTLSLQLAHNLIKDYFILHPSSDKPLKILPNIAPQFVTNFITAVVEMYLKDGPNGTFLPPPKNLLEIITDWVSSNPRICLSQINNSVYPNGIILKPTVLPVTGLIHWCALAPLFICDDIESDCSILDSIQIKIKKAKLEKPIKNTSNINSKSTESELYSKLHLGVLQSLYEVMRSPGVTISVNVQQISYINPIIMHQITHLQNYENSNSLEYKIQICLNRLAQAIAVAFEARCIYGNLSCLISALETLPENRMMKITLRNIKRCIQQK